MALQMRELLYYRKTYVCFACGRLLGHTEATRGKVRSPSFIACGGLCNYLKSLRRLNLQLRGPKDYPKISKFGLLGEGAMRIAVFRLRIRTFSRI